MLQGVLITNAFLRTEKFVMHYEWLRKAAEKRNIRLSLMENTDLWYLLGGMQRHSPNTTFTKLLEEKHFVIFWDKDIFQGKILQHCCNERGIRIFNPVSAIEICDDKLETYYRLWEWNQRHTPEQRISLLPTIAAPMTYENIGYTDYDFIKPVIEQLGLPLIIKECRGSFGMQVYLAETKEEVMRYTEQLAGRSFLYQKYIKNSSGRDVRLQVIGNRVVAAMERFSETGDFRANITNGGCMKAYQPSPEECKMAVRATQALGLDFAGVDLLFSQGEKGKADSICEINSNAHFKNIYTCTGINVAELIMEYIQEEVVNKMRKEQNYESTY